MQVLEVTQLKENRIQSMRFGLPGYKKTILIIEEKQAIRELLTWVMIAGGYRPQETIHDQPVDLLILDLDCSEAWRKTVVSPLWEQLSEDSPPIIFLTCPCHPVKSSGSLMIQKPFHVQDLLDVVTKALNEKNRESKQEKLQLGRYHLFESL